jgi:hypothetical protein
MNPRFLRRKQAGEYLLAKYGFGAEKTLAKVAVVGGGPEYRKAGRIPLYTIEALDNWALAKIGAPVHSTSEAKANRSKAGANKAYPGARMMGPDTTKPDVLGASASINRSLRAGDDIPNAAQIRGAAQAQRSAGCADV